VGNLHPPQVHYSYVISKTSEESFRWKSLPRWSHCDKICQGKQFSHAVCVQIQPGYDIEVEASMIQQLFCFIIVEASINDCNVVFKKYNSDFGPTLPR
jgi:hypothetical protein